MDTPDDDSVIRVTPVGKAWRTLLVLVLASLFFAGSTVGQDDWWPFAPWRMFSTSTAPSGSVTSLRIEYRLAGDPTWRPAALNPKTVGLNRAEVEGRVPELTADPSILGTLAESHSRLKPDEPAWAGVRVVKHEVLLKDRSPTGAIRETSLAEWIDR